MRVHDRSAPTIAALAASALCLLAACEKKTSVEHSGGVQEGRSDEAAHAVPGEPGTSTTAGTPNDQDVLVLGEIGSLTGAQATFGVSTDNGIKLAVSQANEAGGVNGKKLVVRVYDDQGKPEEAANAATRLITQDKVKVILGEVASTNSLAMAPKAQEAKVPMISPSSTNPKVTEKRDFVFRVCFIDPFQGAVMARFARENLKFSKVAILKDQKSDYSLGLSEVFTKKFTELGGKLVETESYSQGDTDFRAQLTAMKAAKPEGIYVPGYYTDVGLIARQARELGLKAVLLGGDGWESEKLFELGGSAVDGSYYSNHYSADDPSPMTQQFLLNYKKVYGTVPDSLAALGFDAARVAIEGLKHAPEGGAALRDAIAKTKDFPGAAGTITLDKDRNATKPAVILQVVAGKLKYITTVAP